MGVQVQRRLFTVEEYHRMAEAGILSEDDRVELIEGELVTMSPIGSQHAACVARLTALLFPVEGRGILWVQNPIRLGARSEPQPDVTLLRYRPDFYASAHPGPEDVLLVVEVAETSADADRSLKIPLYARCGIPEAWLVDLLEERIEIYRHPTPQGYRSLHIAHRGETVSPTALPDLELSLDEILG
jgi:Uma2 family endonuclease